MKKLTHIFKSYLLTKTFFGRYLISWFENKHKNIPLDDLQKKILFEIQTNGISINHLNNFLNKEDLEKLYLKVNEKIKENPLPSTKQFLEYFVGGFFPKEKQKFNYKDEFHRFSINEKLLAIVSNYLKTPSKLCYIELNKSLINPNLKKQLSQKYHRDPGINKCLKIFIYFNDVDYNSGPFTYIPKSNINGTLNHIVPNRKLNKGSYYPSNSELEDLIKVDHLECTGKKGTIVFCDTTGWHFGGNSISSQRVMSTFVYYPFYENIKSRLFYPKNNVNNISSLQKSFLRI